MIPLKQCKFNQLWNWKMETSPSEHHGYDHEHSQDVREEERNVCLFFPNFSVTLFKKKKIINPPAFMVWNLGVFSGPRVGKWKACTCAMGNCNPSETSLYLDSRLSDFQSWLIAEERRVTSLRGQRKKNTAVFRAHAWLLSPYRCPFTLVILAHRVFSILQTSLHTVPPRKSSECS